jgi:hypothetical protein
VSRLCEFYPGFYLTTEEKARVNLSQGKTNLSQGNRPQHDRPVTGVIAQQYSSDIRISLLFIPNWRVSKSCNFSFFPILVKQNCMSLKFPSFEIVLSQGGPVEVANVPDNKAFSLVRDIVIPFVLFYVRRRTPILCFLYRATNFTDLYKIGKYFASWARVILKGLYRFDAI